MARCLILYHYYINCWELSIFNCCNLYRYHSIIAITIAIKIFLKTSLGVLTLILVQLTHFIGDLVSDCVIIITAK